MPYWLKRLFLGLDNYRLTILFSLPIATGLLIYLVLSGAIIVPEWFLDLIILPSFVSNLISGLTYIARFIDGITSRRRAAEVPDNVLSTAFNLRAPVTYTMSRSETFGTLAGVLVGIGVSVALFTVGTAVPFAQALPGLAYAVSTISNISIFAGVGNRLGSCFGESSRLSNERLAMWLAITIGALLALLLVLSTSVAGVTLVGLTTFFTGGLALPAWLIGILFVTSFASSVGSMTDYVTRSINYLRFVCGSKDPELAPLQGRQHEYRGALVGVSVGIVIAVIAVTLLAITQPHLFAGLVGAVAATMLIVTIVGVCAGLCSRIGRGIDGAKKALETPADELAPEVTEATPLLQDENDLRTEFTPSPVSVMSYLARQRCSSAPPAPAMAVTPPLSPAGSLPASFKGKLFKRETEASEAPVPRLPASPATIRCAGS